MNEKPALPRELTRRDILRYGLIGGVGLVLSPALISVFPEKALASPLVDYVSPETVVPNNGFVIDSENFDRDPSITFSGATKIPDSFEGNNGQFYAYKLNSSSDMLIARWDHIGTYLDKRIGAEITYSDFVFNNRVNTTSPVGQNSWENQHPNNPPSGYMPALCIRKTFTGSCALKACDSAHVSIRFFDADSLETITLKPESTYVCISALDNDCGGYEGVVPGKNCTRVIVSSDAFISHGTLKSYVATYENAFWGTMNLTGTSYPARRHGITMFYEGDSIDYTIIDTVGMMYWSASYDPIFTAEPKLPFKSYELNL